MISITSCYLATLIIGPDPGWGSTSTVGGFIVFKVRGKIWLNSFPDESLLSFGRIVCGLICTAGIFPSYDFQMISAYSHACS